MILFKNANHSLWSAGLATLVALLDVREPTRWGQDSTIPAPNERTTGEWVDVDLEYPDFPTSGTPYNVGVKWNYTRITTGRTYLHNVTETNTNAHTLDLQQLITDRRTYRIMHDVYLSDKRAKAILDELINRGWWLSYIAEIQRNTKLHLKGKSGLI